MSAFDLLAASIGLAASALAAALLLPLWRRSPVPAYRLAVSVLAAALALPLLQWGARALDLPVPHPARDLALRLGAGAPAPLAAQPLAASQPLDVPLAELEAWLVEESSAAGSASTVPPASPTPAAPAASSALRGAPWTALLLGLWAAGALLSLARTARRLAATRRLFARAVPVADPARLAVWESVRAGSRVGARARLFESSEVRSPACAGLLRPSVVLPADDSLAGRPELFACVLTHELVHLERRDPWVLVAEELLRAAFWFHPAAWWLVARLGALRELSCDCLVVRRTGKRKRYASALVEYATWMQRPAPRATWAAVVPWSESRGHLTRRIEMLLQPQAKPQSGRVVAPAAVGVLMTFLWSGQLALATSSCAGTRGEHEHEHEHAHAHAHTKAQAHAASATTCEGEPCEVAVVAPDGKQVKRIRIATTSSGATVDTAPVAVAVVDGEGCCAVSQAGAGAAGGKVVDVETHVVVITDDDGEAKVLRGDEAKAWIDEHGVKVDVDKVAPKSKKELVETIRGYMLDADGGSPKVVTADGTEIHTKLGDDGECEVIVVRPSGEKSVKRFRLTQPFEAYKKAFQGHEPGSTRYRYVVPDGQAFQGWAVPSEEGVQAFGYGQGDWAKHPKVLGELFGKHKDKRRADAPPAQPDSFSGGAQGAAGADADLDALRRELEKTRAALEEQRKALEELKRELQKERESLDAFGAR